MSKVPAPGGPLGILQLRMSPQHGFKCCLGHGLRGSPVIGTTNILLSFMPGSKDALKPWDPTLASRGQCPVCSPANLDQQEGTPYQICMMEALATASLWTANLSLNPTSDTVFAALPTGCSVEDAGAGCHTACPPVMPSLVSREVSSRNKESV